MLLQRTSPPGVQQIVEQFAAMQRDFPKAVVESDQIAQNPNRSFAAPHSDVSVADSSAVRPLRTNYRSQPEPDALLQCSSLQEELAVKSA